MSVAETKFEPATVNVRTKVSALWTSMLFVFAYVDLFSLYRPDFRAELEAAEIGGFTVNQSFLLGTTAYVVTLGGEIWRIDDASGPPFGR